MPDLLSQEPDAVEPKVLVPDLLGNPRVLVALRAHEVLLGVLAAIVVDLLSVALAITSVIVVVASPRSEVGLQLKEERVLLLL